MARNFDALGAYQGASLGTRDVGPCKLLAMFSLRPRMFADCEVMVSWVADAEDLYLFTGPRLSWPLTPDKLYTMEEPGLSPWMLVEEGADSPRGHFDLAIDGKVARIGRVLIDPAHRGRGLAHVLVGLAINQAKLLGASAMELNVVADNEPAIHTYTCAGFTGVPHPERPNITVMRLPL
ncbi:GNAT family N-acetyltransferase [Actinomycetaceae bacterium MB13-C1-2]|nr:GNAT family N-acetyltransferase [Actinomycetaceae bacterium MB13-C1-2]